MSPLLESMTGSRNTPAGTAGEPLPDLPIAVCGPVEESMGDYWRQACAFAQRSECRCGDSSHWTGQSRRARAPGACNNISGKTGWTAAQRFRARRAFRRNAGTRHGPRSGFPSESAQRLNRWDRPCGSSGSPSPSDKFASIVRLPDHGDSDERTKRTGPSARPSQDRPGTRRERCSRHSGCAARLGTLVAIPRSGRRDPRPFVRKVPLVQRQRRAQRLVQEPTPQIYSCARCSAGRAARGRTSALFALGDRRKALL